MLFSISKKKTKNEMKEKPTTRNFHHLKVYIKHYARKSNQNKIFTNQNWNGFQIYFTLPFSLIWRIIIVNFLIISTEFFKNENESNNVIHESSDNVNMNNMNEVICWNCNCDFHLVDHNNKNIFYQWAIFYWLQNNYEILKQTIEIIKTKQSNETINNYMISRHGLNVF